MTRDPCTQSSRSLVRFSVAEAPTNLAKDSRAKHATVALYVEDGALHLAVRDDSIGGADSAAAACSVWRTRSPSCARIA